jgi:cyclase
MPLTYGGGIQTVSQIEAILKIGVEKVVVNALALASPDVCRIAAESFGSSTIIGGIDVKKDFFGQYKVYDHIRRSTTKRSPHEYAKQLEDVGVGEIFLNSVDRDGTMEGFDATLIKAVSEKVQIPVIACGGAKDINDIRSGYDAGASALAAGSLFVFHGKHRAVLITYPSISDLEKNLPLVDTTNDEFRI